MPVQFKCTLLSLNFNGLNDNKKRRKVFTWLHNQNEDVIFLQETHSSPESENIWKNEWGGEIIYSHGSRNSRGVAVPLKSNLNVDFKKTKASNDGRLVYPDILIDDLPFKCLNIYAPINIKCQLNFFSQLKNLLLKEECINSNEIIIVGDFNCVQDPTLDKNGGSDNMDKYRAINTINVLMNIFDLHDIWRIRNPDKRQFTWRQKLPRIQCRLDYWLISDCLHEYTRETNIKFAPFADHSPITLELENPKFQSQRIGYWKFKSSLTTDDNY